MSDEKPTELKVRLSDQVKEAMAADPRIAEYVKGLIADAHQAFHGIETGQYESFEEAMTAITGSAPKRVTPEELDELVRKAAERSKGGHA